MPEFTPPYKASWVDRLSNWIENLPIPIWAFYLIFFLIGVISLNIATWINAARPWGQISLIQFYNAIWLPLVLIVIHYTDRLANHALARFTPLAQSKSAELENIRYQMTTMPARTVLWISGTAISILLIGAIQDPGLIITELSDGPIHPATWFLSALFNITSYSLAPVMIYHSIRQLNLMSKVFALLDDINIFHQQPLYAFSGLTMQTALLLVAQVYITYMGEALYNPSSGEDAINLALTAIVIPLALSIVFLPLWGIHQRILEAKLDVLEENSLQIEQAQKKLYSAINANKLEKISVMDGALDSLYKIREQVQHIPTWPWAAGTLRNFLSAIILPMLLWALQVLFGRFLAI